MAIIYIYIYSLHLLLFLNHFYLIGGSACHLCFHQKASEQLQVGVELEVNARIQESTATIAYQLDLPKADLVFKGASPTLFCISSIM